jgi:hypothetical protein
MKTRQTIADAPAGKINLARISPVRVTQLREIEAQAELRCPVCQGELSLIVDSDGPYAEEINPPFMHEPEDLERNTAKKVLAERFQEMFPHSVVELDVYLEEINRFADIVIVKKNGGIIAVEYRSNDMLKNELFAVIEKYRSAAIQPLFMLDYRRLKIKKDSPRYGINLAQIGKFEVELLKENLPLIYLSEYHQQIYRVHVPKQLIELVNASKPFSLGRIYVGLRIYQLKSIRINQGKWILPTQHDPPLPAPPQLPKRLLKRIRDLEKKQSKQTEQFF